MQHESFGVVLLGLMAPRALLRLREAVKPAPLPPREGVLTTVVQSDRVNFDPESVAFGGAAIGL